MEVFCVVVGYQRFGGPYPEDEGSQVLRNIGILPQHYTAPQPGRPRLESSPWKPQNSHETWSEFPHKYVVPFRDIGWVEIDWIHLDQDRGRWQDFVNTIMSRGFRKRGGFLDWLSSVSFWTRTLLHGVCLFVSQSG